MAVIQMTKIRIYADKNARYSITDMLQEKAWMQVSDISDNVDTKIQEYFSRENSELELRIANQEFAIHFLRRFLPKNGALPKVDITPEEYDAIVKKYFYQDTVEKCLNLQEELVKLQNHIRHLQEEENQLTPWQSFDLSLHQELETEFTLSVNGSMPAKEFELFCARLEGYTRLFDIRVVSTTPAEVYFSLVFMKSQSEEIHSLLLQHKFVSAEFLKRRGNPAEEIDRIRRNRKKTLEQIESLNEQGRQIASEIPKLSIISDYLTNLKNWKDTRKLFLHTDDTFCIEGWIPVSMLQELHEELKRITQATLVEELPLANGEVPPVEIHNNSLTRPFEAVTRLYGLPQHNEVDPTPFLAIFFAVYFGLCLTDAGYGLMIVLATSLALLSVKLTPSLRKLTLALWWGGISTTIFGALAGGWFGTDPLLLPEWLTYTRIINGEEVRMFPGQLINPVKEPLIFLGIALALGYFQIIVGKMIDGWWKMKQGHFFDGLFDGWLWAYSLASLAFYAAVHVMNLVDYQTMALYGFLAAIALLLLTQGRKSPNIFGKAFGGVLGLYGFVGYLSDTLSYSRLLALGLATGIIATSVNLVASIAADLIPYVGIVLMIIILIAGHLFNVALNMLGAFVHSGRLQFVEFFGKFMEGGGKEFKPFQKVFKYVRF